MRKDFMGYNYQTVKYSDWEQTTQALTREPLSRPDWMSVEVPFPFNKASKDMQRYYQKGFDANYTKKYNDKLMCWEYLFSVKLPSGQVRYEILKLVDSEW